MLLSFRAVPPHHSKRGQRPERLERLERASTAAAAPKYESFLIIDNVCATTNESRGILSATFDARRPTNRLKACICTAILLIVALVVVPVGSKATGASAVEDPYGALQSSAVSGVVRSSGGDPVSAGTVIASATMGLGDDGLLGTATIGADGSFSLVVDTSRAFTLDVVPSGTYRAGSLGTNGVVDPDAAWENVRQFAPGASAVVGTVIVAPSGFISGAILIDGLSTPVTGAFVLTHEGLTRRIPTVVAPGSQSWSIGVDAGTYDVDFVAGDLGVSMSLGEVTVPSDGVSGLEFVTSIDPRTVSGTLSHSDGRAVAGTVELWPTGGGNGLAVRTALDGSYTIQNVGPASYTVAVVGWGGTTYRPNLGDASCSAPLVIADTSGSLTGVDVVVGEFATCPAAPVTASQLPSLLSVAAETTTPAYDRSLFEHWIDADADGCNTRYEVLIRDSTTPVPVSGGRLHDLGRSSRRRRAM